MKLVWVVIVLASALATVSVACGPQESYCYDQHETCAQAKIDKDQAQRDKIAADNAAKNDAGVPTDSGATVVD